jgi:hypothetical protein
MTVAFDLDEAAARVVADPLDRALFQMLGRQRTHAITVQRVNRLFRFSLTRQPVTIRQGYYHLDILKLIAKTEVGDGTVVELMGQIVEAEIIDPDWVVDLSRNPLIWSATRTVSPSPTLALFAPDLVGQSCELDAVDPNDLRGLVDSQLVRHMSDARVAELEAEEAEQKAEMEAISAAYEHGW